MQKSILSIHFLIYRQSCFAGSVTWPLFYLVSHIASTKGWTALTVSIHPHSGLNHTFRHIDDFHIYVLPIFHKKTDISYIDNRLTDTHTHIYTYIYIYVYVYICIYICILIHTWPSWPSPEPFYTQRSPRCWASPTCGGAWCRRDLVGTFWGNLGCDYERNGHLLAKHGGF